MQCLNDDIRTCYKSSITQWWSLYKQDFERYKQHRKGTSILSIWLTEQSLWALLQYRIASALYHSSLPWYIKRPLLIVAVAWQKLIEMTTGITLPYKALIGPGFYIGHYGNVILHDRVIIGSKCNISQGVTIGMSGRKHNRGVPVIGNRVYIGVNAVIAGKISVGDDAVIAANSLVIADVLPHTTVMGIPANVINHKGSEAYLDDIDELAIGF